MYQNLYLKLKSILQDKNSDVSCIKYNNPDNPLLFEFDQFVDNTLQPYLHALSFVRILEQNFHLGNYHNSPQVNKMIVASKKVFENDNFGNTLRDYCKKEEFIKELQNHLKQPQGAEQKLPIDKRIKNLVQQNTFYKLFITAMSSADPQIQKKALKDYKNKKKIFESWNRDFTKNFQFKQLDVIQKYKYYCQFVQQTVKEFQSKQKSLEGLEEQEKIKKIITDLKEAREQVSAVSQILKKVNKNIKDKQNRQELKTFNHKLKNKEIENLLKDFIAGIQKYLSEKGVKQEKSNYDYLPQQGVTYSQLLHYIDCIYEDIYSVQELSIVLKMERIKQHIQRQKEQSNSQEPQRYDLQTQLNELKLKMEENQKQSTRQDRIIKQTKAENSYLHSILESIFFQFNPQLKKVLQLDSSVRKFAYGEQSKKIIDFIEASSSKNNVSMIVEQKEQRREKNQSNLYLQQIKSIQQQLKYYSQAYQNQNVSLIQKQQMIKALESQVSEAQRQNSSLNDTIDESSRKVNTLQQKIQLKEKQILSLVQRQSLAKQQEYKMIQQKHRQQLETKELQVQTLKAKSSQRQEQIQALKRQKVALQIQMSKLRSNYIQIKQQNQIKSNQLLELKQAQDLQKEEFRYKERQLLSQHQQQLASVAADCKHQKEAELAAQAQKYQKEIAALEKQKLDLSQHLKQFRKKYYDQMGLRLLSENQQKQKMDKQRENKKKQLEELDIRYNQKFKTEIKTLQKQKQSLKHQIEEMNIQKQQLQLTIIEKEDRIQKEILEKQFTKSQLQEVLRKKEELQRDYDKLVEDSKAIQRSFIRHSNPIIYQGELSIMQELNNNQALPNPSLLVSYTKALFNNHIFEQDEFHKQILVKHLEEYASSKISLTRLLYKYDPKNKVNFHQYIDNVKGLLLVIETKNAIIAGFYPQALKDKQILDKGGLLVSVTNDKSYNLHKKTVQKGKATFRGMIYDTFFVIYGNAQLRIKTGFKTVFTNFGVSNGYYNAKGDKVDKFLNEGEKREVQFEQCEFYQVVFQNPKFTQ